jgi:hypothetical protein
MSSPAIEQIGIRDRGAVVIPFPKLREGFKFSAEEGVNDHVQFPIDQIAGLPENAKPSPFSPYESIRRSIEQYGVWSAVLIHKETHTLIAGRSRVLACRELAKSEPEKWKFIPALLVDCEPGSPEAEFLANDTDLQCKRFSEFEDNLMLARQHTLWEQLHPGTAKGKGRSKRALKDILSFCHHEAENQGCAVRTIARKIEVGKKLNRNPEVVKVIRDLRDAEPWDPSSDGDQLPSVQRRAGKFEDTTSEQRQLMKAPLEEQLTILNRYLWPEESQTTHMTISKIEDAVKSLKYDTQIGKYGDLPDQLFPIICADFASAEAADCVEDGSVQLILTDIPYNDLTILPSLFATAVPWLDKERAQIGIMFGSDRLAFYAITIPLVKQYGLISRDEIQIVYPDGSASSAANPEKMIHCHKPVAIFAVNRNYFPCKDTINSAGPEKGSDPWEQPVPDFEKLVERLSDPGDLIVDPFAGTGTTLIAALNKKRRAWGCDKDPVMVEKAKTRMVELGLVKPPSK